MKEVIVLSSACGAMFMPGFLKCLKENGEREIKIIGVDITKDPFLGNLIDKYYQVPSYNDTKYIDVLLNICQKEKVDIFFPHISMELPIILKRIDEFKNLGVKVAITDNKTLNTANNKLKLYKYMKDKGLKVPKYYEIKNSNELKQCAEKLGFPKVPVVVKIAENSGSRGVRIVKNNLSRSEIFLKEKPNSFNISMEDMCKTIDECMDLPDTIVMEYIPGCEYTVDLLADKGNTLYIAGRRNYESSMSIAMATYTEKKEEAYNLCRKIVSLLELDGNIGFDFMLDKDDNPILTDLNPRITATIILYKEAGLNFPYLRVKQLLGEELSETDLKYGVQMKRKFCDVFQGDKYEENFSHRGK